TDYHGQRMLTSADVGGVAHIEFVGWLSVTTGLGILLEQIDESVPEFGQSDAILRAFGAGNARDNRFQVQFNQRAVIDLASPWYPEQTLRLEVIAHRLNLRIVATRRF